MKISRSDPRAADCRQRPVRRRRPSLPALEWVEDVAGRCARATAVGSRSLLVENHTGILEYTPARVRLDTVHGPICVDGSGLSLCDVRPRALIVRGEIRQVALPCQPGDSSDEA